MASITICNLDDDVMMRLRVRAAEQHRSMEEEAQLILRDACTETGAAIDQSLPKKRGKPSQWAGCIVRALKAENPRRPETRGWRAYNFLLRCGGSCTYEVYRAAGHGANHLKWDLDKGNISIIYPKF